MSGWDVAIIGAGVVGLACAARLARAGRSALIIEQHAGIGRETSSRSSQVMHAGMYYPKGSRKAALCVRGNAMLGAYCEARGVPFRRIGKLIVATDEAGEEALAQILARGRDNGVPALDFATRAQLDEEPAVAARAALFSPTTGIVDADALMHSLRAEAEEHGADLALRHTVIGAERSSAGYRLHLRDPAGEEASVDAAQVVNAAGLHADRIAALLGLDPDALGYRQRFVKGSYFRVHRRGLVSRLIYPVPPRDLLGLGVHVTIELDGGIKLGPDAEPLAERTMDYTVNEHKRRAFFEAARRYLPSLREDDLAPDQAGIRPRLAGGEGPHDFRIAEESARGFPGWVNLCGIESPGLTAALPIAEEVAALLGAIG
ncbi:MAG: NAD(P)/FAD-dependent oxidoreductase [Byssovorax sp.]